MRGLLVAALVLAFTASAGAAPAGSPDPAFGTAGIARITYPGEAAAASTLVPTSAGLVVVGGSSTTTNHDGKLIVARLRALGRPDPSFGSLTGSRGASNALTGAVIEPGGRLVVAATGTPGDMYPFRVRLFGFDASGHPDPSFGSGGSMLLSEPAAATALLQQSNGTLLVVGATSTSEGSLTQKLFLARVSADGHELSATTGVAGGADGISVSSALQLGDASVLVAGDDSGPFLAHFTTDGSFDSSYGPGGLRRLSLRNVGIDSMALDGSGRLLIVGFHSGDLGRSVGVPVAALLLRTTLQGVIDHSFAGAGRGSYLGGELELNGVASVPGDGVVASAPDGSVLRFDSAGNPQLGFGVGGASLLGAGSGLTTSGLLLSGNAALLAGSVPAPKYSSRLAVERVLLTGSGVVAPRRRSSVVLMPRGVGATLQVPIALRPQRLAATTAVPLAAEDVSIGDGAFETPRAALVALPIPTAAVTLRGVRASATLRGVRTVFGLRISRFGVALLELAAPRCTRPTVTTVALRGRFEVAAGTQIARNSTRSARLAVRQVCHRPPQITVTSGHATIRHRHPVSVGVSYGP